MVFEDPAGDFDVRTMVPGLSDPWRVFAGARDSIELAAELGRSVGAILAEQHSRISAADVADWLPRRLSWLKSPEWIRERLVKVVDDTKLRVRADAVIEMYEAATISEGDRALVHTDVGFHNLGIDPASYEVCGIFDYDEAAWADRHHDFRYLLFDFDRDELLNAALSAYEAIVGRKIQLERVLLYDAACAITFLAYRAGTHPDERSCGRTLEEDLRWSRHAVARALASEGRHAS